MIQRNSSFKSGSQSPEAQADSKCLLVGYWLEISSAMSFLVAFTISKSSSVIPYLSQY